MNSQVGNKRNEVNKEDGPGVEEFFNDPSSFIGNITSHPELFTIPQLIELSSKLKLEKGRLEGERSDLELAKDYGKAIRALDAHLHQVMPQIWLPGRRDIAKELELENKYVTPRQENTDHEEILRYESGKYCRAEEQIREDAYKKLLRGYRELRSLCALALRHLDRNDQTNLRRHLEGIVDKCERKLKDGPTIAELNEIVNQIRVTSFTDPALLNPRSHIPFRNGNLNIKTRELEPHTADLIFTWQVDANFLGGNISLSDCPMFSQYLQDVFPRASIPAVLEYCGYSLYPSFPRNKVLFIVGRQRVGRGRLAKIMEGLLGDAHATIELTKLLTADRFQFTGTEGKNLLTDAEINRKIRRGIPLSPRNFNNLFGGDTILYEPKGKEGHKSQPHAKGIFIGNLPLFPFDDDAYFARLHLIQSNSKRDRGEIPNLDELILARERNEIATLLVRYLWILEDCSWIFFGELDTEETGDLWAKLADPVENFIDEETEYQEGAQVTVEEAYSAFDAYCRLKGIPTPPKRVFSRKMGNTYSKRKWGPKGKQTWIFTDCLVQEDVEVVIQSRLDTRENVRKTAKISPRGLDRSVSLNGVYSKYKEDTRGGVLKVYGEYTPKMDTSSLASKEREIQGPAEEKLVSDSKKNPQADTHNANDPVLSPEGPAREQKKDEYRQDKVETIATGTPAAEPESSSPAEAPTPPEMNVSIREEMTLGEYVKATVGSLSSREKLVYNFVKSEGHARPREIAEFSEGRVTTAETFSILEKLTSLGIGIVLENDIAVWRAPE